MNEQSIFLAALDIADPMERADYLSRTCDGESTLRRQVEALLTAHERSGEFLDVPALKQMAAGNPGGETSAEPHAAQGEIDLSFLQPSARPGSLGRLGHYEVEAVIGRGGCGIVLKAFDEKLHRVVAIKVMAPELAATSPARKRFLREARATAAIRHENVVSIHAVEEQPLPFLVMEYIEGQTLQQKLDQTGPLDVPEVLRIGHQIASGLEAAHAKGLIHRDIKPGNILLEVGSGHIKITDFGLARSADDASMTQSGVIAGTPLYMSPEQAQGRDIDQRSDLFSLGSVLYVMCSGRPPFRAATSIAVLRRVVEEQPRPIQGIIPETPDWLVALIAKLHAKKPEDRFASSQEFADLLARCLSELQQHGHVEALGDILPVIPQPMGEAHEPVQDVRPKSQEKAAPASLPASPQRRRWVAAAAMIGILLAGLSLTDAAGVTNVRGTIIRLFSPDGTLVVEVDDPSVSVSIDGGEMVITGTGAKEIRLRPGEYKVLASKDGKVVRQELVTVTTNGRQVVRVSKEAAPVLVADSGSQTGDTFPPRCKNALGMEFALVPKGKAWLGGGGGRLGDKEIEFKDDFYLGVYEVTQEEWEKVIGANTSHFSRKGGGKDAVKGFSDAELKRFPVENVSWNDVQVFLEALNQRDKQSGWVYRLPTEAEWEYACRGGPPSVQNDFAFDFYLDKPSNQLLPEQANFNQVLKRTCKVGSYKPNRLGLYDMHGNILEWCADEVKRGDKVSWRMQRGGSWVDGSINCRAVLRNPHEPATRSYEMGLRVARVRVAAEAVSAPPRIALVPPPPSTSLVALRRDQIPPAALAFAGDGDPKKAPPSLVAVLGEPEPIHTATVSALAFSLDGRWLASGSSDNTILLREPVTGKVRRVLRGHTWTITLVAFTPDSKTLVSASADGTVKLWATENEQAPTTLPLTVKVEKAAVSPDGRFLATSAGGEVKLWAWGAWHKPIALPAVKNGQPVALAFSSDGETLACGWRVEKSDSPISLYRTADGTLTETLQGHPYLLPTNLASLSFSPDGKFLASALGGKTRLWDMATSKAREFEEATRVCFSLDSQRLAIGRYGFRVYETASGRQVEGSQKQVVWGTVIALAFSGDGKALAVSDSSSAFRLYDTAEWRLKEAFWKPGHRCPMDCLAVSPDGLTILARGRDHTLRQWTIDAPNKHTIVQEYEKVDRLLAYSPNGKTFVTGESPPLTVWDAGTSKPLFTVPISVYSLTYSPDGKLIAGNGIGDDMVYLVDVQLGKVVHRFPSVKQQAFTLAFSSDGRLLATAGSQGKIVVWNVATGAEVATWETTRPGSIAFHPDGSYLAIGHADGTIAFWDTTTWEKQRSFYAHLHGVQSLCFTPNGRTLLSSGVDGVIQVRNPDQERPRAVIPVGPAGLPVTFDLDASGQYLFASGPTPVIYVHRLPLND